MFEHHKEQLASRNAFVSRQLKYLFFSLVILSASIGIGIASSLVLRCPRCSAWVLSWQHQTTAAAAEASPSLFDKAGRTQ